MKMNEHWTALEQKLAGTEPDWQVLSPLSLGYTSFNHPACCQAEVGNNQGYCVRYGQCPDCSRIRHRIHVHSHMTNCARALACHTLLQLIRVPILQAVPR